MTVVPCDVLIGTMRYSNMVGVVPMLDEDNAAELEEEDDDEEEEDDDEEPGEDVAERFVVPL